MMNLPAQSQDIYLTGNIASGKTTLAKLLAERMPGGCYVAEPYERNAFLAAYLRDKARWAFTSTLRYYMDYVQALTEQKAANPDAWFFFIDAGSWTNALLYARYALGEGFLSPEEYAFYQELRRVIDTAHPHPAPDGFIFVQASPQVCYQRMQARGWSFQQDVDLAYLQKLEGYLEAMAKSLRGMGTRVMTVSSGSIPFHQPDGVAQVLALVKDFLGK